VEYNRITYFLKAAQTLNFTKAAEELYISRQALAKQIALFEEELGVVLFERNTRKIRLTAAGQEAYKRLLRASAEMEKALQAVRNLGQQERRVKLRIGFFREIQRHIIGNITKFVSDQFPEIMLEPVIMEMFELRDALLTGKIDLCMTNTVEKEQWDRCDKLVLGVYPPQIIVSHTHPWAMKKQVTVEDMLQEEFVMLKDKYVDMEGFFENIPCRRQVWMPNMDSILLRLEQGRGFAVAVKYSDNFNNERTIGFPVPESTTMLEVSCLWNREKKNEYAGRVVKLIAELFEKQLPG